MRVLVSLIDGVSQSDLGDGRVVFAAPAVAMQSRITLKKVTPGLASALHDLRAGATSPSLFARVVQTDGPAAMGKLKHYLATLDRNGLLQQTLQLEETPVAVLKPCSVSPFAYDPDLVEAEQRYCLSRYSCIRRHGDHMIVDSPLGYASIEILGASAHAALFELARPCTSRELGAAVSGFDEETARTFMNFLGNARALHVVDADGHTSDEVHPVLSQWAFADLLFHTRSRLGRHADPYGGTFPFKDRFEQLPAVKPAAGGETIPLARPDLERLEREDTPLTRVLESRRSIRNQGDAAITLRQLGEFLYRAARARRVVENKVSFRPSPSAGALHPLEIYPLVDRCEGLEQGLYHYDPAGHQLERVAGLTPPVQALAEIGGMTGMVSPGQRSQILFLISARFQRVQMKYQSVGYAAILKDLGCLYQTMYLVATAMGLAPVALGGGHSDLFAAATGCDYLAETTVGEFLLGTVGDAAEDQYRPAKEMW